MKHDAFEILEILSVKIYSDEFERYRDPDIIRQLDDPLSIFILVMDFNSEMIMNGINDFIGNSTGLFSRETVEALRHIGASKQAELLSNILDIADAGGMTHTAIQEGIGNSEEAVTSFQNIHGVKWDDISETIDEIEVKIDLDSMLEFLEQFVEDNIEYFLKYSQIHVAKQF